MANSFRHDEVESLEVMGLVFALLSMIVRWEPVVMITGRNVKAMTNVSEVVRGKVGQLDAGGVGEGLGQATAGSRRTWPGPTTEFEVIGTLWRGRSRGNLHGGADRRRPQ